MSSPSVLVVDDDEGTVETLTDILTAKQYRVEIARSGEEGISLARTPPFGAGEGGQGGRPPAEATRHGSPLGPPRADGAEERGVKGEATMSLPASILIIDDDRGMCETLGDVLRLKGYSAETAGGGREALEKLRARPFDGAVVDIKLPDISGIDLLMELKGASPDTEVVFITGYASLTPAIQAINGAAV